MKALALALLAVAATLAFAGSASADPLNRNTASFTATCVGFAGEGTSVRVEASLGKSPNSQAGRVFHILGSQQIVLLADTPGLERRAADQGTSRLITAVNGQPDDPFTVLVIVV